MFEIRILLNDTANERQKQLAGDPFERQKQLAGDPFLRASAREWENIGGYWGGRFKDGKYLSSTEETLQYRYITHSGEWSEWREAEYVRSTE